MPQHLTTSSGFQPPFCCRCVAPRFQSERENPIIDDSVEQLRSNTARNAGD